MKMVAINGGRARRGKRRKAERAMPVSADSLELDRDNRRGLSAHTKPVIRAKIAIDIRP